MHAEVDLDQSFSYFNVDTNPRDLVNMQIPMGGWREGVKNLHF